MIKKHGNWLHQDTVYSDGEPFYSEIIYDGDSLIFGFHAPADYPRLPPAIVEAANARHRKACLIYHATMRSYDCSYWRALDANEFNAANRIAIHKTCPWSNGGVILEKAGGYIMAGTPLPYTQSPIDWIAEMVHERLPLRSAKDYALADCIRREIENTTPYRLYDHGDGTEFVEVWI